MTRVAIIPAVPAHIEYLAPRLRPADVTEARVLACAEPLPALTRTVALSHETWVGLVDEEPVAIWGLGIGGLAIGLGRPWLVGSDKIEANAIAFLRRNKACIRRWLGITPNLENWVTAEHHVSRKWLAWLGFTLDEPAPFGPYGRLCCRFHMERR